MWIKEVVVSLFLAENWVFLNVLQSKECKRIDKNPVFWYDKQYIL